MNWFVAYEFYDNPFPIYMINFCRLTHQHDRDIDQYINICNWKCEVCGQCARGKEVLVLRMHKYFPSTIYWWEEISLLTRKSGNKQCLLHSIKSPQRKGIEDYLV